MNTLSMRFPVTRRAPRLPFVLVLAVSLGLVGGGVAMSQFMYLAACPLCIIQRMLYLVLALLAAGGWLAATRPVASRLSAALMSAAAGAGVFVAGYQTWLQRFAPMTSCSGQLTWWEELVEWAGQQFPLLFFSDGICSDPGWKFLGLSIAEWSLACFTGLLLVSLHTLLRRR